jgi:hypothetical protein
VLKLEIARRNRIRKVVSELNKARRIQSRKIDILCNDFVASQKNFLKQLQTMNLQIDLYESLIGEDNVEHVLEAGVEAIEGIVSRVNTAIWLGSGFETHVFDEEGFTSEQTDLIESCFNGELAEKIYKSRRCIELEELFEMGLPESEAIAKLSAAVIPLQDICQQGFILLYREAARPIKPQEISDIAMLIPGLSKAIKACQKAPQHVEK